MFATLATADFWLMMGRGLLETFYMVVVSTLLAYLIGLPLGLVLAVTDSEGLRPSPVLNKILGTSVNLLRSVPFLIMVFLLNGLTLLIVGTTVGSTAMIVGLVVAAFPFVARLVEGSAREVDRGILEASVSMGASTWQIITKVILPECKPSLINGATVATTTILGYSAMAGILPPRSPDHVGGRHHPGAAGAAHPGAWHPHREPHRQAHPLSRRPRSVLPNFSEYHI